MNHLPCNLIRRTFRARLVLPGVREIDTVLAGRYGVAEEELDFILNYDIKYRLGRSSETVDE